MHDDSTPMTAMLDPRRPDRRTILKSAASLIGASAMIGASALEDPQTIQKRADAEVPLEDVYKDWPVSTDPEPHIKTVSELFQSGVSIVNIHTGQSDQKRVIEFYGKEVLPKVLPKAKAA